MSLPQSPSNPFAFWSSAFVPNSHSFASVDQKQLDLKAAPLTGRMHHGEDYDLFIPKRLKRKPAMLVMLHGAGQSAQDFSAGVAMNAMAQRRGFVVLYPNQSPEANMYRCWNWYQREHQTREARDVRRIAALTECIARQQDVDESRIFVAGLSAGGAMAALLGALFPELYVAVGVHSGLAAYTSSDLSSAMSNMRIGSTERPGSLEMPTIVFHGDCDTTVHPLNGLRAIESAIGVDCDVLKHEQSTVNGRVVSRQSLRSKSGTVGEHWVVHSGGHAWSGGDQAGTFTDTLGPSASEEMLRFFDETPKRSRRRRASTTKAA